MSCPQGIEHPFSQRNNLSGLIPGAMVFFGRFMLHPIQPRLNERINRQGNPNTKLMRTPKCHTNPVMVTRSLLNG